MNRQHPDDIRNEWLKLRSVVHDRVTGLPAFPLLFDRLRAELDDRRQIGVIHLEIHDLELVESLYGWQIFDRILERVAGVVRSAVDSLLPAASLAAVNGVAGERFIVFVPAADGGEQVGPHDLAALASALAERVDAIFEEPAFRGISPRLASRTGHALLSLDPFYRFERRVYAAVDEARTMHQRRRDRRERGWGVELKRIIKERAISTLFQPVVDLASGEVLGFEALSRGPKGSYFEMPRTMFAVSSRVGVEADLDRLCRSVALRSFGECVDGSKVFVNLAPGSLFDPPTLVDAIDEALTEARLATEDLVVEVHERSADAGLDRLGAAVDAIRARGFAVALDDVGTGYATLATLERVEPQFLKVDTSLVREIDRQLIKQEMLTSLVQIAERVGAQVICEGIESEIEAETLRRLGARYGQGFHFAAPAPRPRTRAEDRR